MFIIKSLLGLVNKTVFNDIHLLFAVVLNNTDHLKFEQQAILYGLCSVVTLECGGMM